MIGRFLGTDVPACGFSIGFERVVDLVELPEERVADSVALIHDGTVPAGDLLALKTQLMAEGRRVRLERRTKNIKLLLDGLAAAGFAAFAYVEAGVTDASKLALRPLG
jgi:histidyl-tRNA synthetase